MPSSPTSTKPASGRKPWSLRRQLLTGILLPVLLLIGLNTWSLYKQALSSLHTAYDRTLLASAKSISEELDVIGYDDDAKILATVPYSALETFEADNQSRMFYRVSTLDGQLISGFEELPMWHGSIPVKPPYAALVDFYDDEFRGASVRVAILLQPVASASGRGMAVIQVAETMELRETLALQILHNTLARQALLVAVVALIVVLVVQRATQPVRQLSAALRDRSQDDLNPLSAPEAPKELQPLLEASNHHMLRLRQLLAHQKRFVRDASHQLRTPLAVLKAQVQSAQRGDIAPAQALEEISQTVDRATRLANQMLSLAKVEQLRQEERQKGNTASETIAPQPLDDIARDVALDLSPLIAQRNIEFSIETEDCPVPAHEWMLRELCRNLLHNAVRHMPPGGTLQVRVLVQRPLLDTDMLSGAQTAIAPSAVLEICDSGPGIDNELATRLFQPFSAGSTRAQPGAESGFGPGSGSGLGLAICQEIVHTLHGRIELRNIQNSAHEVQGLQALVTLPLWQPAAGTETL